MNLFQIIALSILGFLLALTVAAVVGGRATRKEGLFWGFVWAAASAAILWYEQTTVLARSLGIGRGADLVSYSAVVVMMIGFLMVYLRLRQLRREVTLLVRHLALREAQGPPEGT